MALGVQSQWAACFTMEPLAAASRKESGKVNRILAGLAFLLLFTLAPLSLAQVQVGDDLRMNLSGMLTGGYEASYGNQLPSTHGIDYGGNATLSGSYYNPNFLSFTVAPYYDQSKANSNFQSLTNSSGVNATANFFTGSHFPGFASYNYSRNSTGTYGLIGSPNFTTVGSGQGFGIGWSALLPDWPTFSVSYTQGSGSGNVFGTNEQSSSSTKILTLRSSYQLAGWRLNALYTHLNIRSAIPSFLSGLQGNNFSDSSGNNYGINGTHNLPWHGSIALTFNHSTYSADFGSTLAQSTGANDYTTNTETANAIFRPTARLSLYANETYTGNLNGYLYQNIVNSGSGVPLIQLDTNSSSTTLSTGANYTFTKNLYGQAQITYFDQSYFGQNFQGSYLSGTVGYGKRILNTFTVSGTVIESSNKFSDNSLGFVGNLNGFRHVGLWEVSGAFSYAQNVQTILVTYSTSYYNYSARLGRRLGRGMQWTGAFNGNHSGFTQQPGALSKSNGFTTSLALRRIDLNANYIKASGQSILTSTGIQPLPPTPGLPLAGIVVYNGESYGGGITITPIPRLYISGNYSHATSDTLSGTTFSNNRTEIFYAQLQYRLRKISVLAGYTKFSQGISAAGTPPGSQYSYFVGVTRWFNFF
jgi:hypothetical protein